MNTNAKAYVVGHKNPDTDSICSAIAYAALKRAVTGEDYQARRAGPVSEETAYVLSKFHVDPPALLTNVRLQVSDMDIHKIEGVSPEVSIKETWAKMKADGVKTIPVLDRECLVGIVSTGDIAKSYMDDYDCHLLSEAKTKYAHIAGTLNGIVAAGNSHACFSRGKVTVGASNPDVMKDFIKKDDLVILGNRTEAQECALDIDVSCIVLCQNALPSDELIRRATEQSIVIICTPYDSFTAARLINQSVPVRHFMTKGPFTTFKPGDYVDDIKDIMTKKKFRDFPVLNEDGSLHGFISRRRFMNTRKKQVILVDHNEKSQAVDGIEEADIIEIIDHHRLGTMETISPVFFRNQPVGCTATIVTQMYQESRVEIPSHIAGILCCAIISDTLLFRSPTCTDIDKTTALYLADIAGISPETIAGEMFRAGSSLRGKTPREICMQDFKQFSVNDTSFGVGQISSLDAQELTALAEDLAAFIPGLREELRLDMIFIMLTNILEESSHLVFCGSDAPDCISRAFDVIDPGNRIDLPGVVSRKKQLIPALVSSIQQ